MVSDYGDKQTLQLILNTAHNSGTDPNDRLLTIEVLEELGYREVPRKLLLELMDHPELDNYWAGDLLLRFGDKTEALKRFRRAIKSCPTN